MKLQMLLKALAGFAKRRPQATAIVSSGVMVTAADCVAQIAVEKRTFKTLDLRRLFSVSVFACIYIGGGQYQIYRQVFDRLLTASRFGRAAPLLKAGMDNFIVTPFVYLPVFFYSTSVLRGFGWETGAQRLADERWDTAKAAWTLWVPAQVVNFALVPNQFRVPFMSCISFGWNTILAVKSNQSSLVKTEV